MEKGKPSGTFGQTVSASSIKKLHEKKIQAANEPPGKKETVWAPNTQEQQIVHKQTKRAVAKGPPPKMSISQLP